LLGPVGARAQPVQPGATAVPERRVEIILVGLAGEVTEFADLLAEWLNSHGRRVAIRREPSLRAETVLAPSAEPETLKVWVVLVTPERAVLYLAEPAVSRFLVRDVPLRNALDELGREQIAQILVASVQAFVEHRAVSSREEVVRSFGNVSAPSRLEAPAPGAWAEAGSSRQSPPASEATAEAVDHGVKTPGPPRWRPKLGGLYAVTLKGPEGIHHGPGLLVGMARAASRVRWDFTAKGQYQFQNEGHGARVAVSTSTFAVRLTAAAEMLTVSRFGWGAELGGGVDYVAFSPGSGPGLVPRPAGTDLRPVLAAGLRGSIALRDWRLSGTAGISTLLVKRHYDLAADGRPQADLTPWPVQPAFAIEASWP
jgi:hypothetical protein